MWGRDDERGDENRKERDEQPRNRKKKEMGEAQAKEAAASDG